MYTIVGMSLDSTKTSKVNRLKILSLLINIYGISFFSVPPGPPGTNLILQSSKKGNALLRNMAAGNATHAPYLMCQLQF